MKLYSAVVALLFSVFFLVAGNALAGLIVPLRAHIAGFPELSIGFLGSAYFAGMLGGTLAAPAIVRRAGHIRAFSAFVAGSAAIVILYPLLVSPAAWLVLRGGLGFAFAGVYGVTESWINSKASNANRGGLYAIYQIVTYAASACGQLLLTLAAPTSYELFSISGILLALAVVPLAMTDSRAAARTQDRAHPPRLADAAVARRAPWRRSRSGRPMARSGRWGRSTRSASASARKRCRGSPPRSSSARRSASIRPGASPTISTAASSSSWWRGSARCWRPRYGAIRAAGTCSSGLALPSASPLSRSIRSPSATPTTAPARDELMLISSSMLFLYCVGAIAAPALAAAMMRLFGPSALFAQNALVHLGLAAFTLWRILLRRAPPAAALRSPADRPEPGVP